MSARAATLLLLLLPVHALGAELEAGTPQRAAPTPTTTSIPVHGCIAPSSPELARIQKAADDANRAAFEKAFAAGGWKRPKLGATRKTVGQGLAPRDPKAPAEGSVVTEGGSRFIVGEAYWSGAPRLPDGWEFVEGTDGTIHRLYREGKAAAVQHVRVCGAHVRPCPPFGSPCPACGATIQVLYGPIGDAKVGAPVTISSDGTYVQLEYLDGESDAVCGPPPP